MEAVIDNDPHILSRSLTEQFTTLIVDPLESIFGTCVAEDSMALPNLTIIDSLDECMDGTQVQILNTIFTIGKRSKFPFVFLVAMCPEEELSTASVGDGRIHYPRGSHSPPFRN